jgi:lysyl-tRNA synthetase class 2
MAEEDLYQARLTKLEALRARGVDPWPVRFDRTHKAAELQETHATLAAGEGSGQQVRVAGRLQSSRTQGKLAFGDVVDVSGQIQLFVTGAGVEAFDTFDVGDIVGASGEVVRTKRGELSVRTEDVVLLAKALRSPPDKWHGVQDTEVRFRQRYLDLIANPDARRIAQLRPHLVRATREFFDARDFVEVETPVLHPIPGGGTARPFVTHFNAIDQDMYLRIATELYLKRLVVGGMERVYEIGRIFRNEGLGFKYNPEFTMLEAYQAYADYTDMMELVQTLITGLAQETTGSTKMSFRGHDVDFKGEWRRVTMCDLVSEVTGTTVNMDSPADDLRALAAKHGVPTEPWWNTGLLIGELYDKVAEATIVEPTLVMDYPKEISPLARLHRDDPRLVERFESVVCGMELTNAFSELNDPIDQRARFEAQDEARAHGDLDANPMDEPFVQALEYGMPPTGGMGMGVDRLAMVLAGVNSIREVILFPALRPETADTVPKEPDAGEGTE